LAIRLGGEPNRRGRSRDNAGVATRSFGDANMLQRALRNAAATTPGAAVLKRTGHHLDRGVSRLTGGRTTFSTLLTGIPVVLLTSTGARSGRQRTVAVAGIPHPDGLGVIASNFGQDTHPAWYHNLKANPEAVVRVGGDEWKARARLATPAERDDLWQKGLELYPGWRKYEARAGERKIQAFVLERQ
jgi:deazaflavin-dependent oxidoreductase (nitroreductase family)